MPISFLPAVWAGLLILGGWAVWYVVDEIGDRREAKVWRQINAAMHDTNERLRRGNTEEEKNAALAEAERLKAIAAASQITEGKCPATDIQAKALSRIR